MPEVRAEITGAAKPIPWTSLRVVRTLQAASAEWAIQVAEGSIPGQRPGAEVSITYDGATVVRGFVDRASVRASSVGRLADIAGREPTADLIDGSFSGPDRSWLGLSIVELAQVLAAPYGVGVEDLLGEDEAARAPFQVFALQPGESPYLALERAARQRGVLLGTNPDGALTLYVADWPTRSRRIALDGTDPAVLSWSWSSDHSQRFRTYQVIGQAFGGDWSTGLAALNPEGEARDLDVRESRTITIVADGSVDVDQCEALARWHAAVTAARYESLTVSLVGWDTGGRLWAPGELYGVTGPNGDDLGQLLVGAVEHVAARDGQTTRLELVRADAFQPKPETPSLSLWGVISE